ncbi:MAG: Kdo2-lipid lauroyltransferase/acyltransferase [Acidobacteriota bacterium]|jgi:KDO2-lipid IV(A) lauroyltransferase|nr:Kdo2-lipid lauroyltransferase/acyltransferase [Acidobacteriota bacterium]
MSKAALYRGLMMVTAVGRRLSLDAGRAIGRFLGALAWHVARRERLKALRNLAIAFPELSDAERRALSKRMFAHLGMSLLELTWIPNVNAANRHETTVVEGLDKVLEVIDSGRGVIIFTAHCGNWEWLSYITGTFGRPVSVLQRERDEPAMNRYITELRAKAGVKTIDRGSGSAARDMINAIRRGGILAFVLDQNIRTESVKVPFFGRPALTPIGPVSFAIRTEATISVAFIERRDDGKQYARFETPIHLKRTDDPIDVAAQITQRIEEQIRRVPEQWVWMHDRWRERPKWEVDPDSLRDKTRKVSVPGSA